jgi:hypothetical protein
VKIRSRCKISPRFARRCRILIPDVGRNPRLVPPIHASSILP